MRSLLVLALLVFGAAPVQADEPVLNVQAPVITRTPTYLGTVTATPGTWTPADVVTTFQWKRDGVPIPGATGASYAPPAEDIGHLLSVLVTATKDLSTAGAESAQSLVLPAAFEVRKRPAVTGVRRFERTLTATRGRWSPQPERLRFQWLRDGEPIAGATRRRYRLGVEDVETRVSVRVTAKSTGYADRAATSRGRGVRHRVDARHTVRYTIATRGHVTASLNEFARQAQETLDDPRGWRGSGVRFVRVAQGGAFTLFLSQAAMVPSFGFPCDTYFSCRVGNAVVINQDRWLGATPVWNGSGRSLRDYRSLVVNHETGHWLGHGHSGCSGPGKPAPVMMQQSKGLHGCYANPWPVPGERGIPRF